MQAEIISLTELSSRTGYSEHYLYKLTHLKKLPFYKPFGGRLFFDWNEVKALLLKKRQGINNEGETHE